MGGDVSVVNDVHVSTPGVAEQSVAGDGSKRVAAQIKVRTASGSRMRYSVRVGYARTHRHLYECPRLVDVYDWVPAHEVKYGVDMVPLNLRGVGHGVHRDLVT